MIVNFKEDYVKAVEKLDPRIKNNGAFKLNFEYKAEDRIHEGAQLEITTSEDGKSVRLIDKKGSQIDFDFKSSAAVVIDVNLRDDDGLEVIQSRGDLLDADYYYKSPTSVSKNDKNALSVLSVSYIRSLYDKAGIEMQVINYSNSGIPCGSFDYSNIDSMISVLLSAGNLMPIFYGKKTELPTNSANAIINTITRDEENPCLLIRTRLERGKSADLDDFAITSYAMGMVDCNWGEILSFGEEPFADYIDGMWEVRTSALRTGAGDIEAIKEACTQDFSDRLEKSNTKRFCPVEYKALREKIDKVLEKSQEKEISRVR